MTLPAELAGRCVVDLRGLKEKAWLAEMKATDGFSDRFKTIVRLSSSYAVVVDGRAIFLVH